MKIEHVALWTNNLETMKNYYATFFQGRAGIKYHNSKTGFSSYFIDFESGTRLEIMSKAQVLPSEASIKEVIGYAHIAFSVGSKEKVDYLTDIIRKDCYKVFSEPRTTGDGYYESCVSDPEGNRVEITI